jgi:hypothetical protein
VVDELDEAVGTIVGGGGPVGPVADEVVEAIDPVVGPVDDVIGPVGDELVETIDVVVGGGGPVGPVADELDETVGAIIGGGGPVGPVADEVVESVGTIVGGGGPVDDLLDTALPPLGGSSGGPSIGDVLDLGGSLVAPLIDPVSAPIAGLVPSVGQAGSSLPSLLPALPGSGGGGSPPPAGPGALVDRPASGPGPGPGRAEGTAAGPGQVTGAGGAAGDVALNPGSLAAASADGVASISPAEETAAPLGSAGPRPLAHQRGNDGLAGPGQPFGWTIPAFGLTGTTGSAFAFSLLGAQPTAPEPAAAIGGDAPGSPQAPAPSGSAAGSGAAGVASSTLFALLVSLAAFALRHFTRLQLAQARWRPQAFVAVLERPG